MAKISLNPFDPNAPFLYPLKTSENRKVFWCFQGVEKRCIGNEWVKNNWTGLVQPYHPFDLLIPISVSQLRPYNTTNPSTTATVLSEQPLTKHNALWKSLSMSLSFIKS